MTSSCFVALSNQMAFIFYYCVGFCFSIISKCMNEPFVNTAHLKRWLVSDKNIEPLLCQSIEMTVESTNNFRK